MIIFLFILFWFVIYFIEGFHDANFEKQLDTHPPAANPILENYYRGRWHTFDSIQFALFHIVTSYLLTIAFNNNFTFFFISLFVSIGIRIFAHDLFYDIGVNRGIFTVPTCQGNWDFWDCSMVWLNKKTNLPPIFFRFLFLVFSIFICFYFN